MAIALKALSPFVVVRLAPVKMGGRTIPAVQVMKADGPRTYALGCAFLTPSFRRASQAVAACRRAISLVPS